MVCGYVTFDQFYQAVKSVIKLFLICYLNGYFSIIKS